VGRRTVVFLAILVAVALAAAWLLELTWERAIYLAPVIVICALAVTALIVRWAKVIVEGVRGPRRDRNDSVPDS
jgi:uncharacterized membrane protein